MWSTIKSILALVLGFIKLRTAQAKGEKARRKVAEREAQNRKKQQDVAADSSGPDFDPERLRDQDW